MPNSHRRPDATKLWSCVASRRRWRCELDSQQLKTVAADQVVLHTTINFTTCADGKLETEHPQTIISYHVISEIYSAPITKRT